MSSVTALLAVIFISFTLRAQEPKEELAGLYKYAYAAEAEQNESHYILLEYQQGHWSGIYCGSSDDFDEAREGYLPGYFCSSMDELQLSPNSLSFVVHPKHFYNKPLKPQQKPNKHSLWEVSLDPDLSRSYQGSYVKGQWQVHSPGLFSRKFIKLTP